MKRSIKVTTLILTILLIISCASIPKTPQDRYDEALARWNSMMREYRTQYILQPEATQFEWNTKFSQPMYEAGLALNAWEGTLSDYSKEQAFMELKKQVTRLLIEYNVIKIEEK